MTPLINQNETAGRRLSLTVDIQDDIAEENDTPEQPKRPVSMAHEDETAIFAKIGHLPFEIQDKIWEYAILQSSSQVVELCYRPWGTATKYWYIFSQSGNVHTIAQTSSRSRAWALQKWKFLFTSLQVAAFPGVFFDSKDDILYLRCGHEKFEEQVSLEERKNVRQLLCTPHEHLAKRIHSTFPKLEKICFVLKDIGYDEWGAKRRNHCKVVDAVVLDEDSLHPHHIRTLATSDVWDCRHPVDILKAAYKKVWEPLECPEFAFVRIVREKSGGSA